MALIALAPSSGQMQEGLKRVLDDAVRRIVRLPPTAFPELPGNVVQELQRRGCRIPQVGSSPKRLNVIKGEFAKPGQTDWAALCSIKGVSSILVFWNGSEKNPAVIAPMEDSMSLQGMSPAEFRFTRAINPVAKSFIMRHYQAYGGLKPPPITHQGIDDSFLESASVTWYFHDGKWLKLTGAD